MRFTLHYSGPLKATGSPKDKHAIRRAIHEQLAELWEHPPLKSMDHLRQPASEGEGTGANVNGVWVPTTGKHSHNSCRKQFGFTFVPLATQEMNMVAALDIILLRPEAPGGLITAGGDVDNRLKTLFDALTMPRHVESLPKDARPASDEEPFYVLLEDDNLVTSLSVRTEHLLKPVRKDVLPADENLGARRVTPVTKQHVELIIGVHITATMETWGNGPLVT